MVKKIEDDPEFDKKKARKVLRRYVESHDHAIRLKAEIMVDHFHDQVMSVGKIGGKARAMVVCGGIERAIQYYHAYEAYLKERKSPYQAIVAFSGEFDFKGEKVTEASLNGFASSEIADKVKEDPYRFLSRPHRTRQGTRQGNAHAAERRHPGLQAVRRKRRLPPGHQ